ncbi:Dymeclin [Geodia barretti]|uniref:Dymeclin n=1 Tax=Geodia barretti TaxID=519541 RepID=A0AA35SNR1_GEOBA|nr:Dymeclin [Geodia barretti]
MGVTVSTSLAKIKENPLLLRFVGSEKVAEGDGFWKELLTFTAAHPASQLEARLLDEAVSPLIEALLRRNGRTGHLRSLVRLLLDMMTSLGEPASYESHLATLHVHNALLIVRVCLKQLLLQHSEEEVIVQLDGATTVPQIWSVKTSGKGVQSVDSSQGEDPLISLVAAAAPGSGTMPWNEDRSPTTGERSTGEEDVAAAMKTHTQPLPPGSTAPASLNPAEVVAMDTLLSRQLVEGLISLLINVPVSPTTYSVHEEAMSLLLVFLSSQMYGFSSGSGILLQHILSVPTDQCNSLVHRLVLHFSSQPSPPPSHLHSPSSVISSITTGIWSMMSSTAAATQPPSPLADGAVLLLLVLTHQQMSGHNQYRRALLQFTDEHSGRKTRAPFSLNLQKLYLSLCNNLSEQTTLLLYLLLQGNPHVASFIFSRSDIDLLHLQKVEWYSERSLTNISVGSLMVIVLVRTIQANISHIQDKYLHTNCLAALANMSSHFNSLHLDAAQKIVTLFKQLAKKYHRMTQKTTPTTTPTSATPLSPDSEAVFRESADFSTEVGVVEEILVMILEIVNSCLSHRLATNPHLVYCLLYQREVFSPLHTSPPLMDLVRNILSVVEFFSKKLEESGPSPYSSPFVLETIIRCSATWPHHRLRVFPELKFRYVEEAQPEEFFVPYVWTLVHKNSPLYWQQFHVSSSPSSSSSTTPH